LSQFSRRARWLAQLFTPSVTPNLVNPTSLSDDVSLVQQYDGGGIGMAEATFPPQRDADVDATPEIITEPEVGTREYITRAGITVNTELAVLASGLYARILGVTCMLDASASPTNFNMTVGAPTSVGLSDHRQNITASVPEIFAVPNAIPLAFDIVPPGFQLNAWTRGGLSGTKVQIDITWIVAPIGAIIIGTRGTGMNAGVAS